MIYLVVGLDGRTLAPWHRNVHQRDVASAVQAAVTRAFSDDVDVVVAAVIGTHSSVLDAHPGRSAPLLTAA